LTGAEHKNKHTKDHKQPNNTSTAPSIFGATPLESEQQTDDSRQEEKGSNQVQLLNLFLGGVGVQYGLRALEEEQDEEESDTSNR
jgi:hypothetical protein